MIFHSHNSVTFRSTKFFMTPQASVPLYIQMIDVYMTNVFSALRLLQENSGRSRFVGSDLLSPLLQLGISIMGSIY